MKERGSVGAAGDQPQRARDCQAAATDAPLPHTVALREGSLELVLTKSQAPRPLQCYGGRGAWDLELNPCCSLLLKTQCCGVDAISQPGGLGTVFEDMSQVGLATAAEYFSPMHEERIIPLALDRL